MSVQWIERLYNLQELDLRIRTLNTKLKMIPPEKNKLKEQAGANIADINNQKKVIQDLELKIKQNELNINSAKDLIKKLEQQSSMVKKNSEYEAMLREIAETKVKISDIEDNSLELMDVIADKVVALEKNTKNMKLVNGELKSEYQELDELEKTIKKEIAELTQKRNLKLQGIEIDILNRYEALLNKGTGKPIALILGDSCENCRLKITASTLAQAKKGQVVFCDNCQHFLFLEEHLPL
ncbi:MAG: hypothetical protein IJW31_07340 [Lentisphaeria bacterium]|nr:hypothetical protein [Lentisphaeria bacterium]